MLKAPEYVEFHHDKCLPHVNVLHFFDLLEHLHDNAPNNSGFGSYINFCMKLFPRHLITMTDSVLPPKSILGEQALKLALAVRTLDACGRFGVRFEPPYYFLPMLTPNIVSVVRLTS